MCGMKARLWSASFRMWYFERLPNWHLFSRGWGTKLERKIAGSLKWRALKFKKASKSCCCSLPVENLEGKTLSRSSRTKYLTVTNWRSVAFVLTLQWWRRWPWFKKCAPQSSVSLFLVSIPLGGFECSDVKHVCGERGREEFLSSRCYCVLFCFVSVPFVSRIREMTQ